MRKFYLFTISSLILLAWWSIETPNAFTKSNGSVTSRTNAPGESKCSANGCHGSNAEGFDGNIKISFADDITEYAPGKTHEITVEISDPSFEEFGFQITALVDDPVGPASLSPGEGGFVEIAGTNASNSDGRYYLTHSTPNDDGTWTFEWTAPNKDIGPISFYAAGLATNDNGSSGGDHAYYSNVQLEPTSESDCPKIINGIGPEGPLCSKDIFLDLGAELEGELPEGVNGGPYFYASFDEDFSPYKEEGTYLISGIAGYNIIANNSCDAQVAYIKAALILHENGVVSDGPPTDTKCFPELLVGTVVVEPEASVTINQQECLVEITANCPNFLVNGEIGSYSEELTPNEDPVTISYTVEVPEANCNSFGEEMFSCMLDGIDDLNQIDLSIYPNPADQFTLINATDIQAIAVYNANGQQIELIKQAGSSLQIETAAWPNGIYVLQVKTKAGWLSKKMIVQH